MCTTAPIFVRVTVNLATPVSIRASQGYLPLEDSAPHGRSGRGGMSQSEVVPELMGGHVISETRRTDGDLELDRCGALDYVPARLPRGSAADL